MSKLSIIIPMFNESRTIAEVLKRVGTQRIDPWEKEIIVVDDGSTDGSGEEALRAREQFGIEHCIIVSHDRNQGKGSALRTGMLHATGAYVLIQDADLEYDPANMPVLLDHAQAHAGCAVYGARAQAAGLRGYVFYVAGARFLTGMINLLFGSSLTDAYTGYKLISRDALDGICLQSRGFECEAEITAQLLKRNVAIREVPIRYTPRSFQEGKKIRMKDGAIGMRTILSAWRRR